MGAAGGLGAKLLSKDEGSSQLGVIAVVFALLGIVFTAYFIGRERAHNFVGGMEGSLYKEQVAWVLLIKSAPTPESYVVSLPHHTLRCVA